MAVKKKKTIIKKGKKKWAPIYAPAMFGEALLGESHVFETSDLNGKYLTANLSTITKNMRKQNANIQFKVIGVEDGKGKTEVVGYNMINSALKRLVRRGRDKVADSFISKTSDKRILRIKPLIVTVNHTTKLIQSACRLEARKIIREYVVKTNVEGTVQAIVEGKLQKIIKDSLKKIFPIKSVDIRMAKLVENTKIVVTDKEVVSEPVKKRKLDKKEAQKWKDKKAEENAYVQADDIDDLNSEDFDKDTEDFDDDQDEEEIEEEPKEKSNKILEDEEESVDISEEDDTEETEEDSEDEEKKE